MRNGIRTKARGRDGKMERAKIIIFNAVQKDTGRVSVNNLHEIYTACLIYLSYACLSLAI